PRIVTHLPWQIPRGRFQALAYEPARKALGGLRGGIYDSRPGCDKRLQIIDDRHALSKRLRGLLVVRDIRPGSHELQRSTPVITDHPERVPDPDIVSVPVAQTVFRGPSTLL